ncbi:MAG: MoaD/ThiS family protein [Chloroflexi bacterium]|nr:MoaD/ThiS family protein [Chloroflexota bacterium]
MANAVKIPTPLRPLAGGKAEVTVDGASTIEELITKLDEAHEGFKDRMCDEDGELRRFINIYVRGEDIRFMDGLATSLSDGDEVSIVPAVSGGAA